MSSTKGNVFTGGDVVSGASEQKQTHGGDRRQGMRDFIAAVNHPLRVQMMAILTTREASPVQLSRELGEEKGVAAYHVRKLEEFGMIELVRERQVRGSTEHFFKARERAWFDEEEWMQLDPKVRSTASAWTMDMLGCEASMALNDGTFDRRGDRHLSRTPMVLDELGWKRVVKILDGALDQLLEVQAESAERMTDSDEEPIPTTLGMFAFEMPRMSPHHDGPPAGPQSLN